MPSTGLIPVGPFRVPLSFRDVPSEELGAGALITPYDCSLRSAFRGRARPSISTPVGSTECPETNCHRDSR